MAPPLPYDSARLAWWLSAWLRGDASPDAVLAGVAEADAAHHVSGLPDEDDLVPLVLALGSFRGATSAGLALPAPGAPAGVGGPAELNLTAVEVGEAVVLDGADTALVPHRAGGGVVWVLHPARRRPLTDLGEADRSLRGALTGATTALAALDVARWRPEVADALMDLRHRPTYDAPRGTPSRAVELAGRAAQAMGIVDLALEDQGAAVSAAEIEQREQALKPLGSAARHALVAACSPEAWPPA